MSIAAPSSSIAPPPPADTSGGQRPLSRTIEEIVAPHWRRIQNAYTVVLFLVAAMFAAGVFFNDQLTPEGLLGAVLVTLAGLWPGWLWVRGKVGGLPIIPLVGMLDILWYAMPILTQHSTIALYRPGQVFAAAATHAAFLAVMTLVWWRVAAPGPFKPASIRVLSDGRAGTNRLLMGGMVAMFLCAVYFYLDSTGYLWFLLYGRMPSGMINVFITSFNVLTVLTVGLLSFAMGSRSLRVGWIVIYVMLFVWLLLSKGTSLILNTQIQMLVAGMAGFALGRGRIPWRLAIVALAMVAVFHWGKEDMRQKYWTMRGGSGEQITLTRYAGFYSEWMNKGFARMTGGVMEQQAAPTRRPVELRKNDSLFERMSMIHMLMLAQDKTPSQRPYLRGETYRMVPALLVPRVFWRDKPRAHIGQETLGLHYGLLTEENLGRTFIAWGMSAEAYANFGYAGIVLIAVLLGLVMGVVGRASQQVPIGSFPFLAGTLIFLASVDMNGQVMSLWSTKVIQMLVVIWLASVLLMEVRIRRDVLASRMAPDEWPDKGGAKTNA